MIIYLQDIYLYHQYYDQSYHLRNRILFTLLSDLFQKNIINIIFKYWLIIPLLGYIRISTVFTLIILFFYIAWKFKYDFKDSLYHSVIAIVFITSLYEVIFNIVAAIIYLNTLQSFIQRFKIWHYLMVGGWFILGYKQIKQHFQLTKASALLLSICLISWIIWILIGFPYNVPSDINLNLSSELFNIITKITLLFGYALGLQTHTLKNKNK